MLYFNYVCGYSSNKITLVALFVSVRVSTIYSKDYILMIHCKNESKKLNALAHKSKEIKFYLSKGLDL
ncbi:hypothetical protein QL285_021974 [Trifolium repens]|nr:hypothetical protein QL285_021974 [Trifolium repens]